MKVNIVTERWTLEQKARFLESALASVLEASDPIMPFRAFKEQGDREHWCAVMGRARETLNRSRAATKEEMKRVRKGAGR